MTSVERAGHSTARSGCSCRRSPHRSMPRDLGSTRTVWGFAKCMQARRQCWEDKLYAYPMPTLYVVRHGRVASSPIDPDDPELSAEGQSQAASVAQQLRTRLPGKLPILTSPLRRCRETAAPLCEIWGVEPVVEPRIAEVPGPPPAALPREEWLRRALVAEWPELIELGQTLQAGYDSTLASWRAGRPRGGAGMPARRRDFFAFCAGQCADRTCHSLGPGRLLSARSHFSDCV